jgi:hypothetical protein
MKSLLSFLDNLILFVPFSIISVYQVYNDFYDCLHFFGAAFGNHQREGNEGVVLYQATASGTVENVVLLQKPEEKKCRDALVAV